MSDDSVQLDDLFGWRRVGGCLRRGAWPLGEPVSMTNDPARGCRPTPTVLTRVAHACAYGSPVESRRGSGWGVTLVLVGAGVMVLGSFMEWARYTHANPPTPTGITLPLRSLYRQAIVRATGSPQTSPGALLLVLAVIAVISVLMSRGLIASIAGLGGALIVGLVTAQIVFDQQSKGSSRSVPASSWLARDLSWWPPAGGWHSHPPGRAGQRSPKSE